jgi:hypothetical protein
VSSPTYFLEVIASAGVLVYIAALLRKERLKERHAVWWLAAGTIALVFSVFPTIPTSIAESLGFQLPTNFLFFVSIVLLFLVAIQTATELTNLEEKTRTLAEKVAVLELKNSELTDSISRLEGR